MTNQDTENGRFAIKDCALAAIATGVKAYDLGEFMQCMQTIHPGSIYYHFWGGLLRPRFDNREYHNDFASWAAAPHGLHDETLAERLSAIDPTDYSDMEDLRNELADIIDGRLYESIRLRYTNADSPFQFIRSQIVVFDTHRAIASPQELSNMLPHISISSIFYHFIDARRRTDEGMDDFRLWLEYFGEEHSQLYDMLAEIDPYFTSLAELRQQLIRVFSTYFGGDV